MAKKFKVAAQMYGFRDFMKTPDQMKPTLKKVKKMGYDFAQISGVGAVDTAELRKMCEGEGVTPIGTHVSLPLFRENEKNVIAYCHALGVKYVAIPWLPASDYKTLADWKKLFKEFDGYAKRFAKEGLVVQYHNHDFEFEKFGIKNGAGGATILEMLYAGTEFLQAELDFGWIARGGADPANWAAKMKGRLDQVHLKDWGIVGGKPEFRAIGEGSLDWARIIAAAKKSGTTDFIVEQDTCPVTNDPFLSYAISRKNLNNRFGI
ncbi:MAG: sugar phosphate isomerase/epimerase [Kiritimatiellaeota bacterium]|nr:sugar phosphate isomerase/epimerase [Kiritimatiellota bacterium]